MFHPSSHSHLRVAVLFSWGGAHGPRRAGSHSTPLRHRHEPRHAARAGGGGAEAAVGEVDKPHRQVCRHRRMLLEPQAGQGLACGMTMRRRHVFRLTDIRTNAIRLDVEATARGSASNAPLLQSSANAGCASSRLTSRSATTATRDSSWWTRSFRCRREGTRWTLTGVISSIANAMRGRVPASFQEVRLHRRQREQNRRLRGVGDESGIVTLSLGHFVIRENDSKVHCNSVTVLTTKL